ncbi:MAG: cyclic pyranopterin monophosphate synthase MoaC [Thaumarchaeota archaeon]|nr:cyclic pyranopterin monophosphate synthase MoaC [Nitrososphaerota archaeon]
MKESFAKVVDISPKDTLRREAVAEGTIFLRSSTMDLVREGKIEKGDPLQIASIGAIQAAKSTSSSLMLCHPIPIEAVDVKFTTDQDSITAIVSVLAESKTGVEMEALNAVTSALLNIWDVVKKYEKDSYGQYPTARISNIRVVKKTKG